MKRWALPTSEAVYGRCRGWGRRGRAGRVPRPRSPSPPPAAWTTPELRPRRSQPRSCPHRPQPRRRREMGIREGGLACGADNGRPVDASDAPVRVSQTARCVKATPVRALKLPVRGCKDSVGVRSAAVWYTFRGPTGPLWRRHRPRRTRAGWPDRRLAPAPSRSAGSCKASPGFRLSIPGSGGVRSRVG